MTPIRVAIVENHPLYRRGLVELLAEQPDVVVGWTATSVPDLERHLRAEGTTPDVVLLDRHLPDGGPQGGDAVAAVVTLGLRVLVVSATGSAAAVAEAVQAGASGYVTKDAPEEALVDAIRAVAGRGHVTPPLDTGDGEVVALSPREREVLRLIARGESDAEIGRHLAITPKTVQSHLDRMHVKTGIRNRRKLSLWAFRVGLLEPDREPPT